MDNPSKFTAIEWCAGYGGIHLGLKRAIPNLRVIAYGEIEAFAASNLVAKMEAGLLDPAPLWTDIKTFPCEDFRDRVGLLVAGYPCQPFSAAGKRLGAEDPRHLWPHIARAIGIIRPRLCFFENVEGHISLGLREVIGDLGAIGYTAAWGIFSASEVGAPHQRKRVFILAVSNSLGGAAGVSRSLAWNERIAGVADNCGDQGCGKLANSSSQRDRESQQGISLANQCLSWREEGSADAGRCLQAWPSRPGEHQHAWEPPRVVEAMENTMREGSPPERAEQNEECPANSAVASSGAEAMGNSNSPRPQERTGQRGAGIQGVDADGGADAERQTQPSLGRDADGPAGGVDYAELCIACDNRTDELRLLGNGVVPATAERAFRTLWEELSK